MGGFGKEERCVAATSAHPAVLRTVHALLGGQVKIPASNRGIYGIFPSSTEPNAPPPHARLGPHHDNNPFVSMKTTIFKDDKSTSFGLILSVWTHDLGGVIYMSKVGSLSGGYTVPTPVNMYRPRIVWKMWKLLCIHILTVQVWPGSHKLIYQGLADEVSKSHEFCIINKELCIKIQGLQGILH